MKIELLASTPNPEELIVKAGRVCYQSVSRSKGSDKALIKSLIKSGHLSVLEHASATFKISDVSRAMTHQLVRHRLCSFSQQSQRYVKEDQFQFVIPTSILSLDSTLKDQNSEELPAKKEFENDMKIIQGMYNKWKLQGLKNEDARALLPNACCTTIVVTANFRQWRAMIKERCDYHAQEEIRKVMLECLQKLHEISPVIFKDLYLFFLN